MFIKRLEIQAISWLIETGFMVAAMRARLLLKTAKRAGRPAPERAAAGRLKGALTRVPQSIR